MRPVDKGQQPVTFNKYGDARHHLAKRIGYYCSYCEMPVKNMIEVEHILPVNQGGDKLDWNNFLLSCKYCNTIKSDHNDNLEDYLWPDIDNTDLAFEYSYPQEIKARQGLDNQIAQKVGRTINLLGLNRFPGAEAPPTLSDTRWRSREQAWNDAQQSLANWQQAPIEQLSSQIAITAYNSGHYCIWMTVFAEFVEVSDKIDQAYQRVGLFKHFDQEGRRIVRPNGSI